ncbi:hypothetical protein NDU88_009574 [Pleurodeles waltl]|uniref:Uncharacterized protein n=1 Tax=Pleurodeles waltl TaxID=8319 RepID=A0AAV7PT59_PLEWA|nr:hypothetical protein NDU88_009574 [Pleurodeles waltl]
MSISVLTFQRRQLLASLGVGWTLGRVVANKLILENLTMEPVFLSSHFGDELMSRYDLGQPMRIPSLDLEVCHCSEHGAAVVGRDIGVARAGAVTEVRFENQASQA